MHVVNSLNADTEKSLMIDDLKENIEGAALAGMKVLHLDDYTFLDKRLRALL